ncbi:MAG: S1 RNA-binding domain-containing protein [Thaumarchaeota archaeon]|jgi:translation initiation factor 2 subunit 1|nr:S1 RNA-binding domain-containing protein [Candidatus Terraquivivens yellowstonensis]MCL7398117.1 S1 RNA-binding domain-containing protein [Candidatus Terraquivivens yellowstonensis]MCL7399693.1 S1 RNA-binding domain-containing protein [Candidatus Terraquivivens yellowstonensis]MCL7400880.1 S1 RNA-binding domain-containing protein [Candidatus Terraquivivens yellowstonensis]
MSEKRLPEVGEVVIGTVKRIDKFGAYVSLDEYDKADAFIHVSEISLRWVRNIRDYLREGQKAVFKVLRSDPTTMQVDLSLRRVSKREKVEKLILWKKKQKVKRVIKLLAEKTGLNRAELEKTFLEPIKGNEVELYDIFERLTKDETIPDFLKNLPENVLNALKEIVKQEIKRKSVVKKGILVLYCQSGNGVVIIRNAVKEAMSLAGKDQNVTITVIGPPRYLLKVEAEDSETSEKLLNQAAEKCIEYVVSKGGKGEFKKS